MREGICIGHAYGGDSSGMHIARLKVCHLWGCA
ncbi:hypothetical protein PSPHG_CDS_0135 [Pseudomonas phage Psxphi15]